jgi:hypothetical protein
MENKSTLKHEIETNKATLISWFMRQYVKPYSGILFFCFNVYDGRRLHDGAFILFSKDAL